MAKVTILIDGGHLRVLSKRAGHSYDPNFIERAALGCVAEGESVLRILYYDCAPFNGSVKLPVSGEARTYTNSGNWLHELARKDLFAVRKGVLKFRGFKPKRIPVPPTQLSDDHFEPVFEQKGVDMRIGLDIATFSENRSVDRILLISADTDCIPAMKHGRKAGLQMALVRFPNSRLAPELLEHADFDRLVSWPS